MFIVSILYFLTVLIWGSTWLIIKFQLGIVPVELSVGYRFAIASFMLFLWCFVRKEKIFFPIFDQILLLLQGACFFSLNIVFIYFASEHLNAGMIAVIYSSVIVLNVVISIVLFKKKITTSILFSSILSFIGICIIFIPDILRSYMDRYIIIGVSLAFGAAILTSFGNMIAIYQKDKRLSIFGMSAYGMGYGAIISFIFAFINKKPIIMDFSLNYLIGLFYLSIFSSVLAFSFYFLLMRKVGEYKTNFIYIFVPIVALV